MRNALRIGRVPLGGALMLFLLGGLLGLPVAYDPRLSAPWLLWLAAGAALYITVALLARRGAGARLAATLALAGLAGALLLATQYRLLGFDRKFGALARLGGWLSAPFPALPLPHIDANAAAATLVGALPLACGLAWAARGRARLLWLACAGLTGLGVLLTASRGAWAALAGAALLGALAAGLNRAARRPHPLSRRAGRLLAGLGLAATALVAGALLAQPDALGRALDALALRAADRLTVYRNDFFLALDLPFSGIGPGATFGEVYSRLQLLIVVPLIGYAHNLLLGAWLAQGALGLLGLLGLAGGAALRIGRGLARGAGPLAWGAGLGAAAMLLHGLTDAPQYDTSWTTMLMGFALLGLALGCADAGPGAQDEGGQAHGLRSAATARGAWRWVLGWLPLALCSTLVLVVAGRQLGAAACANVAAVLRTHAQLRPGLDEPQRAELRGRAAWWSEQGLRLDPESTAALKQRGLLAADAHDFAGAARLLSAAFARRPADQSLRKALGYAELWSGQVGPGVALLSGLTYVGEVRKELAVWPVAWRQRQREDLARRAEQAAALLR